MFKIALDAGHGLYTPGKRCLKSLDPAETREWVLNSRICEKIQKLLQDYEGYEILRVDDINGENDIPLSVRTDMANAFGADIYLAVHHNAGLNGKKGGGAVTIAYTNASKLSLDYQRIVHECFIASVGDFGNRAVPMPKQNLHVLRETNMPAVLIECGFMDSPTDVPMILSEEFAEKAARGLTNALVQIGGLKKKETCGEQTVMKIPNNVYVQEINPKDFSIKVCDCRKRSVDISKYFNAGFFSSGKDVVVPIGNLACNGKIITQAKDNEGWMNTSKKKMTTIYTTAEGSCGIARTDDLSTIVGLKDAISGIPIIVGGKRVDMDDIKNEGYFGDECYNTWHGFLGIRHGKLVYVAMKCAFNEMCWTMVALGIYDAIKLDGGGSFILHDCKELVGTSEDRRIHNIGIWS